MDNSYIHDIIKIEYIRLGYLPNIPYHMITDDEMISAFLSEDLSTGFFIDTYPNVSEETTEYYNTLVEAIRDTVYGDIENIPDWIYTYMLGEVVSQTSTIADRHNLLVLLGTDNIYDEFDEDSALKCYEISKQYIAKVNMRRPPTIFGEPHVIKMLRLSTVEI